MVRCVNDVVPRRRTSLLDKVLKSSFNVILSNESGGTTSNSICVDYYLDLNAKAVKLDSIDILKAELFRKNYQLMTEKWKNVQRAIKRWNLNETNYPNNTFYFHFFACVINKYLRYELTKLTPELKVTKNIESDNEDIKIGTHIIEAIDDAHFCEIAMEEIEACVKCFEAISDSHGMIYPEFLTYFGGKNSAVANSAYYILNTILKMDNEVPKILATKYFLEVMNKEVSEEKDYKIIYYIYVLAILFVTTQGKKASPQLVRIVLSKDWMKELRDLATQKYNEDIHKIIYDKPTKFNKTVTKRSGQFLPKHIFAVRQYILPTADKRELYVPNEGRLKEYLEDRKISAEHFFVNQSENYEFHYGEGEIATIKCPAKVKKFISYPINYLYLDKHENTALGDGTIVEKIEEEKIDRTYLFYKNNIKRQILDHILNCHPSFFEQLVVNLLLEMGYGSDELSGRVIGKSHDGGIDGVIYEDKLGLSKIYIQAKRNNSSNTIGRPVEQVQVPVRIHAEGEIPDDKVIREFNSMIQRDIESSKDEIDHLGRRSRSDGFLHIFSKYKAANIDYFRSAYPQERWVDFVKKSRKVSKDKALKALRERSHITEAKAEMDRILISMIATSEFYNQELENYDKLKEIYEIVLESLTKPTIRLESACFVWMVKK